MVFFRPRLKYSDKQIQQSELQICQLTSSVSQGNIPQFLTNRGRIGSDSMPPTTVEISTSKGYTGKEHSVIQFPGATKVPIGTKVQFRQGTINSCGGKEKSYDEG